MSQTLSETLSNQNSVIEEPLKKFKSFLREKDGNLQGAEGKLEAYFYKVRNVYLPINFEWPLVSTAP